MEDSQLEALMALVRRQTTRRHRTSEASRPERDGQSRHGEVKKPASSRTGLHTRTKNQTPWRSVLTGTPLAAASRLFPQRGSPRPGPLPGPRRLWCVLTRFAPRRYRGYIQTRRPTSDGQGLSPLRHS